MSMSTAAQMSMMRQVDAQPIPLEHQATIRTNTVIVERDSNPPPKKCYICQIIGHFATECQFGKTGLSSKTGRLAVRCCGLHEKAARTEFAKMPPNTPWMVDKQCQTFLQVDPRAFSLSAEPLIEEDDKVVPLRANGRAIIQIHDDGSTQDETTMVGREIVLQRKEMEEWKVYDAARTEQLLEMWREKDPATERKRQREQEYDEEEEEEEEVQVKLEPEEPRPAARNVVAPVVRNVVYPPARGAPIVYSPRGKSPSARIPANAASRPAPKPSMSASVTARQMRENAKQLREKAQRISSLAKKQEELEKMQEELEKMRREIEE